MRYQRSHPGYLLYLAAAMMTVSVLLSGSRAGAAISLGLIIIWVGIEMLRGRSQGMVRLFILAGGLLLVSVCSIGGLWLLFKSGEFSHDLGSLYGLTVGLQGRWLLLKSTVTLLADRWVGGVGAGCFAVAFPYYQPRGLEGLYFSYAHNDWLQYVCELGVLGSGLLAAVLVGVLPAETWRSLVRPGGGRRQKDEGGGGRHSIRGRYEREGLILALGGLAVHAMIDFPLHIPSIAVIAAAWVGLLGQEDTL